jgi:1,4-alpha-glucan branching enzyme
MYMSERFGAWQVGGNEAGGKVEFKLFFPDRRKDPSQYRETRTGSSGHSVPDFGDPKIVRVQVAGDFQKHLGQSDWDFERAPDLQPIEHPKGRVWTFQTERELPADFYEYKYYVTFESGEKRKVGDPCTRYGGRERQNAAFVIGGSDPEVRPLRSGRLPLHDLVVYELMIDDFTDEFRGARAPLDAVRVKLEYLKNDLGVTAILFMPWTAWPTPGFNWGYNPYQYFSVEYRYANTIDQPAEKLSWLKNLISECHDRDLHVIMDGVFNHVGDPGPDGSAARGFPYHWLYQDPEACPYVGTFGGTFAGLQDLDFFNGCTQEFIRDVCLYWIDDFKIDGIRFDNTVNFYLDGVDEGLPRLLRDICQHAAAQGQRNFSLTLEHIDFSAARVANLTGATSYWNNELYQRCFDYLWNGRIDPRILNALDSHQGLDDDKVATLYLGNHDHSHVAWQAGGRDNAGALEWYRTQPYAIALFTAPGVPMIQNGQEFAEDYWLMEDDQGSNRRVKPRPLRWDFLNDSIGSRLERVYARLIRIRKEHPGLRSPNFYPSRWESWQTRFNPEGYGVDTEKQVAIFHRWGEDGAGRLERFIVVLNFSGAPQVVDIPFSTSGVWQDLLNDHSDTVSDFRLLNQQIESNWGRVYYQVAP